jgi:hypothetical protein
MVGMNASNTADFPSRSLEMASWKTAVGNVAAILVAIPFLVAGIYHALDPFGVRRLFEEILVWPQISLALVLAVSVGDMFAGGLLLVPRYRRIGAWLAAALLIIYMSYFAYHYNQLVGVECSCFPWVKRAIGPGFFAGDAAILVGAIVAGLWSSSRPWQGVRTAVVMLAAMAVFTGLSYGYAASHLSGTKAPDTITVEGKPYSLQHGKILLFFYDPHCSHCDAAATGMAKLHWKSDVNIIAIPTNDARFAAGFLHDTGLKAQTSTDLDMLKKVFPFPGDPPYGVAIEDGRMTGPVSQYEGDEPAGTLRKLGYID